MTRTATLLQMPEKTRHQRLWGAARSGGLPLEERKHFFVEYLVREKSKMEKKEDPIGTSGKAREPYFSFFESLRRDIAVNRMELRRLESRMDDWRLSLEKSFEQRASVSAEKPPVEDVPLTGTEQLIVTASMNEEPEVKFKKEFVLRWREKITARYAQASVKTSPETHPVPQNLAFFIDALKKLEEKNAQLIGDNITINELSEELLSENHQLREELNRARAEGRKVS